MSPHSQWDLPLMDTDSNTYGSRILQSKTEQLYMGKAVEALPLAPLAYCL